VLNKLHTPDIGLTDT